MKNNCSKEGKLKIPIVDPEICTLCKNCINACPENAIKTARKDTCSRCMRYCLVYEVPCKPEKVVFEYEYCNNCGKCIDSCPVKAISWFNIKNN